MNGISYERLKRSARQWPCPTPTSHGVARRYRNKIFPTPSGRARFHAMDYVPPAEKTSAEFPLVLNTGRFANHWHTRTKTGHVPKLDKANPTPFVTAHPDDVGEALRDGDSVRIVSRRGAASTTLKLDDSVQRGTLFMPFHWGQLHNEDGCINTVTNEASDPVSREPELKFSAVRLEKIS
jgi:predicted molibdopterin-dependent oxidoreductase YjgC